MYKLSSNCSIEIKKNSGQKRHHLFTCLLNSSSTSCLKIWSWRLLLFETKIVVTPETTNQTIWSYCTSLALIVSLKSKTTNGEKCDHLLACLLDSCSTSCLKIWSWWLLLFGTQILVSPKKIIQTIAQGIQS